MVYEAKPHNCEWHPEKDATFKAQIMKMFRKQRIGTQMYWYACTECAPKLDDIDYLADREIIKHEPIGNT